MISSVDILENELLALSEDILSIILRDRSTNKNIFWATDDYVHFGNGYSFNDEITSNSITGGNGNIIMPRIKKKAELQFSRIKDKAEVFTPSWICNMQNNLVDAAWFGKENVFNTELRDSKKWISNPDKIIFPKDKNWQDYVRSKRMEITCGEAPYITSRYDATTGIFIPIKERIGLLDRKLRVINENVHFSREWLRASTIAYQNIYAFEWQGDSLLLAREAMLYTFIDYYEEKFGKQPPLKSLENVANIISWNVWQMDGLKGVVPESCISKKQTSENLFGEKQENIVECEGCKKKDITKHTGIYCMIKDWDCNDKKGNEIKFIDLLNE